MGAKGRKRKQLRKAKNRTGLVRALSGDMSVNQCAKRRNEAAKREQMSDALKRYFGCT